MKVFTLITGGSSGIGRELAKVAVREKRNVILVSQNAKRLTETAAEIHELSGKNIAVEYFVCDLSKPGAAQKVFNFCSERNFIVNELINNAGFGDYGDFASTDSAKQRAMITVNILALTELTHLFLPGMIERKDGKIMNLGSVASFLPGPRMSVYYASKNYALAFSRALQEELRGSGVSVTCLCPGPTKTSFAGTAHVGRKNVVATSKVSAQDVAEFGWYAMQQGEPVAIHGLTNRFAVQLAKFTPRNLLPKLVKTLQR